MMVRQGDILMVKADGFDKALLAKAKEAKPKRRRVVIALGEVTGHSHTLTEEKSKLFTLFDGREVVVVEEPDVLTHQEHAGIEMLPGVYFVVHQTEYTPQGIVRVAD